MDTRLGGGEAGYSTVLPFSRSPKTTIERFGSPQKWREGNPGKGKDEAKNGKKTSLSKESKHYCIFALSMERIRTLETNSCSWQLFKGIPFKTHDSFWS